MTIELTQNSYGKSAVRFGKLTRHANYHDFKEIHVNIQLEGDFTTVYTEGSNIVVLPTDTMKNTIFILAKQHAIETIEDFGLHVTQYFLENNPQIEQVTVDLQQIRWERMSLDGSPQPFTYIGGGNETATAKIVQNRSTAAAKASSGISAMRVLKTTNSAFEGYIVDKYTTLPPAADRILATELTAVWQYAQTSESIDFQQVRNDVRRNLLAKFAEHHSHSVQHTLYVVGEAILENVAAVSDIHFEMPNLHYIPFNLKPFGLENDNDIFTASGDAFGLISGTVRHIELF